MNGKTDGINGTAEEARALVEVAGMFDMLSDEAQTLILDMIKAMIASNEQRGLAIERRL
jgi:hypothetical protein